MKNGEYDNTGLMSAYESAEKFAKSHYENFPVVSLFLPKYLRKHVAVVYQFARDADDLADEGLEKAEIRIQNLESYESQLKDCLHGKFANDFWMALKNTIDAYKLTPKYFSDLLSAFKQDVIKKRYENFDSVLDYCRRSANPVGRIILELFDIRDNESVEYSDAVCTALQLTNFYQDTAIDFQKNRIYIPQNEMLEFGVSENTFELKTGNGNFTRLLEFQVERTQELFNKGRKLVPRLPKQLRFQIRLTILGGEEILKKIKSTGYNVLNIRPKLSKIDYVKLFIKSTAFDGGFIQTNSKRK